MILAAFLIVGVWIGSGLVARRGNRPAIPEVNLGGVDPKVAELIAGARNDILDQPSSAVAWGKLGEVLGANAFYQQAAVCLAQAERLEPGQARWPYLRGRMLQEETPAEALPELIRASDLAGVSPPAPRLTLAEFLIRRGDVAQAEKLVQQVLDHDPLDARALLDMGRIAQASSKLRESQDYLVRSIEAAQGIKASHVLLATVDFRLGDRPAAELALRQAADLPETASWPDPLAANLMAYRVGEKADLDHARSLLNSGKNDELVQFTQDLVRRYPQNSEAWEDLGVGLARQHRLAEAEHALRTATQVAPNSIRALIDVIVVLGLEQRYAEVELFCRKAIALNPDAADPHYFLGAALAREQRWPDAIVQLQKAVALRPDVEKFRVGLGDGLVKTGHPSEGAEQFREALKLNPDDPLARQLLQNALAPKH